jgi:hypothetical protein
MIGLCCFPGHPPIQGEEAFKHNGKFAADFSQVIS